jgi:hypothetical protein
MTEFVVCECQTQHHVHGVCHTWRWKSWCPFHENSPQSESLHDQRVFPSSDCRGTNTLSVDWSHPRNVSCQFQWHTTPGIFEDTEYIHVTLVEEFWEEMYFLFTFFWEIESRRRLPWRIESIIKHHSHLSCRGLTSVVRWGGADVWQLTSGWRQGWRELFFFIEGGWSRHNDRACEGRNGASKLVSDWE